LLKTNKLFFPAGEEEGGLTFSTPPQKKKGGGVPSQSKAKKKREDEFCQSSTEEVVRSLFFLEKTEGGEKLYFKKEREKTWKLFPGEGRRASSVWRANRLVPFVTFPREEERGRVVERYFFSGKGEEEEGFQ